MFVAGLIISLIIGLVLGLVGGGGSILTVPLVHYFFGESMLSATTYSLFVVAVASGIGSIQRIKQGEIDFKLGILFVIPSMLVAFSIRRFLLPLLPEQIQIRTFEISQDHVITFALLIVLFYTAIKSLVGRNKLTTKPVGITSVMIFGAFTGFLSGIIGAGGGFIIVPILVRMGLEIKKAISTSLFIISIQSFIALSGDMLNPAIKNAGGINWELLLLITIITIAGVFIGTYLHRFFSGDYLRKLFSYILLAVSIGIIIKLFVN